MTAIHPFIRFSALTGSLPNRFFTKAYDCRLLYVVEGSGWLRLQEKSLPLAKDCLAYYPPGTLYQPVSSTDQPMTFLTVNFDFDRAHTAQSVVLPPVSPDQYDPAQALPSHCSCGVPLFQSPFLLQTAAGLKQDLLRMNEEWNGRCTYHGEIAAALLSLVLHRTLQFATTTPAAESAFEKVRQYIQAHYQDPVDNHAIGKALNYHPYYLNHLVKRRTGKTLHQYLMEYRMERAMEFLSLHNLSVAETAERTGFVNPNHFSRCFKEYTGISPSQYKGSQLYI